jgi:hypothetical protein
MGPALYKYASRKNAEALVLRGEVRVGTLEYYRAAESLDPSRADPDEGRLSFVEHQSGAEITPFAAQFVRPAVRQLHWGNTFRLNQEHPNCLVYCVSHEYSRAAAGKYDACVRITHPGEFFKCLTRALQGVERVSSHDVQRVSYASREQPGSRQGELNPAFVKPGDPFAREKEVRAIWLTSSKPLQPYCVLVEPALANYVILEDISLLPLAA